MTTATAPDLMDKIDHAVPQAQERHYFGQVVTIDVWECVFERGQPRGRRPYDPTRDMPETCQTACKIVVQPADTRLTFAIEQEYTTADKEFFVTRDSYAKLGYATRAMRGVWCHIKRQPVSKYAKRGEEQLPRDQWTGERTAIVFLEIYPDQAACQTAADAYFSGRRAPSGAPMVEEADLPANLPGVALPADAERGFAARALAAFQQVCGNDATQLATMIAGNPLVARFFNPDGTPKADAPNVVDDLPF